MRQRRLARRTNSHWNCEIAARWESSRTLWTKRSTARKIPPDVEITARAGGKGRADYEILPSERGDAHFGGVIIRYQSVLRIAERWASADLAQTIRVYPNFEASRKAMLYRIRSKQVQMERRL